jgi:hypothetical protein
VPIKIYVDDDQRKEVAWLCDDNWRLPDQVDALWNWLKNEGATLAAGRYIVDIGFAPRSDASGGGAAMSPEFLDRLADLGMSLFLSEYPPLSSSQ